MFGMNLVCQIYMWLMVYIFLLVQEDLICALLICFGVGNIVLVIVVYDMIE